MKICSQCKIDKPLSEFNKASKNKDGHRSQCQACQREYQRGYNVNHKDAIQVYQREWNKRNPDKRRKNPNWPSSKPEYFRKRRKDKPESGRSASKRYRETEHGRMVKRTEWQNRRAKKSATQGRYTVQDVKDQYRRQKGKCYWCGKNVGSAYHVDHVIPLDKGGTNGPDNIVISCAWCNESKNNKYPHEWYGNGGKMF